MLKKAVLYTCMWQVVFRMSFTSLTVCSGCCLTCNHVQIVAGKINVMPAVDSCVTLTLLLHWTLVLH